MKSSKKTCSHFFSCACWNCCCNLVMASRCVSCFLSSPTIMSSIRFLHTQNSCHSLHSNLSDTKTSLLLWALSIVWGMLDSIHIAFWDQICSCHQIIHSHSIIFFLILRVLYKIYQEVDSTSNGNCLTIRYHEIMRDFIEKQCIRNSGWNCDAFMYLILIWWV